MAYEMAKRLKETGRFDLLLKMEQMVPKEQAKYGKLHHVFKQSFDCKPCYTEKFMEQKIYKFILIGENVLNFHSDTRDYYEELHEELIDENGWIVCLNMPEQTQYDFRQAKLNRYLELMELENWRTYKPFHLFKKINNELNARLTE